MQRRILITAALPYANGDIHLGHLVEYIQADIWTRYQKLRGNECYFVCADDAHGTPIMLRAESENIAPEALITRMRENHLRDFTAFGVNFDCYHSTHSTENETLATAMFRRLRDKGLIAERDIEQLYDEQKQMFLPDRYVRGECPRCGAPEQYGDSCEKCSAAYSPTDLKNPRSVLSDTALTLKTSSHYFLRLDAARDELQQWTKSRIPNPANPAQTIPRLQKETVNKMREWLDGELRDWDISRDAPYFGFRIPDCETEKYFYVWLDAPIGYMASFQHFCNNRHDVNFDDFWNADNETTTELYHFIGKDILYFHALFWPVMLSNSGHRRPTQIFAHGFLTVNGEKMSKSRGTFITADTYLSSALNPEFLRYYYAYKLNDHIEDLDLNLRDFELRINSDLIGKLINIPSRIAGFLTRHFDGVLDNQHNSGDDFIAVAQPLIDIAPAIAEAYDSRRYHDAMCRLMQATDVINAHINESAPWQIAKDDSRRDELHAVCSGAMRAFHLLLIMLQPVLPSLAARVETMLNISLTWQQPLQPLPAGHVICQYSHLLKRINAADIDKLIIKPPTESPPANLPIATIDDFSKIDLRIAEIIDAAEVKGADKLLKLSLDLGDGRPRQVFSGIKKYYAADTLIGRRVLYFANLAPKKMRFGESEGMVLAAVNDNDDEVKLMDAPADAPIGAKVR